MKQARTKIVDNMQDLIHEVNKHSTECPRILIIHKTHQYKISWEETCTDHEFHSNILVDLRETLQEQGCYEDCNAIDYALGAIKTLVDMGVLDK